ncbi:MAG: hypothetical protein RJR37_11510 [Peptococcaceae bacterium MAG4]|nr:hypothetical protein [Peptococcaceae bacterium MAG4]
MILDTSACWINRFSNSTDYLFALFSFQLQTKLLSGVNGHDKIDINGHEKTRKTGHLEKEKSSFPTTFSLEPKH